MIAKFTRAIFKSKDRVTDMISTVYYTVKPLLNERINGNSPNKMVV